jgi:hypothetical protein
MKPHSISSDKIRLLDLARDIIKQLHPNHRQELSAASLTIGRGKHHPEREPVRAPNKSPLEVQPKNTATKVATCFPLSFIGVRASVP